MKFKTPRMQEVEFALGRPLQDYLREQLVQGASVPTITARLNQDCALERPIVNTTVYNWLRAFDFHVGRAFVDPSDGSVYFAEGRRRRAD